MSQEHDAGNLKGMWAEAYVLEAVRSMEYDWILSARKATEAEDRDGSDLFVRVDWGWIFEVPIQVKASAKRKQRDLPVGMVQVVVGNKKKKALRREIKSSLLSIKRHLCDMMRFREKHAFRESGFLIKGELCFV